MELHVLDLSIFVSAIFIRSSKNFIKEKLVLNHTASPSLDTIDIPRTVGKKEI